MLALIIIFSSTVTAFADEATSARDTYYELDLPFTYAETGLKNILPATLMIPGDSSTVYIKAEDLKLFLELNYFEYSYAQTTTQCSIINKHFGYVVIFELNTNRVLVYAGGSMLEYEAPVPSLFKNNVTWLPLEFTFRLFNISYHTDKSGQLIIETPAVSQLMVLSSLSMIDNYAFDWVTELGYSESQRLFQHERSKLINTVAGLLTLNGNQWLSLLTRSDAPVNNEYAREIATLFTSPSATEIDHISNSIPYTAIDSIVGSSDTISKNLSSDGSKFLSYDRLIKFLKDTSETALFKNCKKLKSCISSLEKNKTRASSFITSFGKKVNSISNITDYVLPILEYISYYVAVCNKGEYAAKSLESYAASCTLTTDRTLHDFATAEYDSVTDSLGMYLEDHFLELVAKGALTRVPLVAIAMLPANLFWSLLSKNIAESYTLSEHAIGYQNDAKETMKKYINSVFGEDSVSVNQIKATSQYAYAYLKFSSIAREYAMSSVNSAPKIEEASKQEMLTKMKEKNDKIANLLIALESGIDGYLPDEVSKNANDWNTDLLIKVIRQKGTRIGTVTQGIEIIEKFTPTPGDGTITANAAVSIVVEIMGGKTYMLLADYILQHSLGEGISYDFVALEEPLYIEEISTFAYLVRMGIGQEYDQYCVFVPVDGSAAWLGIDNGNNTYYCYLNVDLKNFKMSELISAMEEMYIYGEGNGLVFVEDKLNN